MLLPPDLREWVAEMIWPISFSKRWKDSTQLEQLLMSGAAAVSSFRRR